MDLSKNKITTIFRKQFSANKLLEFLNIERNMLTEVEFDFGSLPLLGAINLDDNLPLRSLDGSAFEKYATNQNEAGNRTLSVEGSGVACDCSLKWAWYSQVVIELVGGKCDPLLSINAFKLSNISCVLSQESDCTESIQGAKDHCILGNACANNIIITKSQIYIIKCHN